MRQSCSPSAHLQVQGTKWRHPAQACLVLANMQNEVQVQTSLTSAPNIIKMFPRKLIERLIKNKLRKMCCRALAQAS